MPNADNIEPNHFLDLIHGLLERSGFDPAAAELAGIGIGVVLVGLLAFLANLVAKRIILRVVQRIIRRTPWKWDDVLYDHHVFTRLSHLAPALVIDLLGRGVFHGYGIAETFIQNAVLVYILVILLMVISAILNAVQDMASRGPVGENVPIKGFVQAIKLVVFMIGGILALSVVFGKSPIYFLSGIGALTAVMLLIFRDALLGLVAGVMISVNQMVRVGDWIEMPSNTADGNVIDVSLTTVKVRNWDRTITTIPSYDLISKSFKNWRGMVDSGGRRIKRAILIDLDSVRFVDEELLSRLRRIKRLRPYLEEKLREVEEENKATELDLEVLCNGRRLTNLGTFRAYCVAYMAENKKLRQDMISIVRQLAPTEHGVPLEIYVFTCDTGWVAHEGVQSDLFDHLYSVIEEFGLRVYQQPSGNDLKDTLGKFAQKDSREPKDL